MAVYQCLHDIDTVYINEVLQGTDVDTILIRYHQHRDVDDVNDVIEVWKYTDVYMISTRYRQHRDVDDVVSMLTRYTRNSPTMKGYLIQFDGYDCF